MFNRIYALFVARNIEFFRDRAALSWSILLPVLLIFGFAYAFTNDNPEKYKVGYISTGSLANSNDPFLQTRFVQFIPLNSDDAQST